MQVQLFFLALVLKQWVKESKELMERSLKIKAHIEKADLLRKNMELFPLVDKEVGDSLLKP